MFAQDDLLVGFLYKTNLHVILSGCVKLEHFMVMSIRSNQKDKKIDEEKAVVEKYTLDVSLTDGLGVSSPFLTSLNFAICLHWFIITFIFSEIIKVIICCGSKF